MFIKPTFGHAGRTRLKAAQQVPKSILDSQQVPANIPATTPKAKARKEAARANDYTVTCPSSNVPLAR